MDNDSDAIDSDEVEDYEEIEEVEESGEEPSEGEYEYEIYEEEVSEEESSDTRSKDDNAEKKNISAVATSNGRKRRSRWDSEPGPSEDADGGPKPKRKSRWSPHDSKFKKKVDRRMSRLMSSCQAQIAEIEASIEAAKVDGEGENSKVLEELMLRRQKTMQRMIQDNLSHILQPSKKSKYKNSSARQKERKRKWQKKLYIPINEYPDYNFIGLILGPRGRTQKQMQEETGARIVLRGKGCVLEDKNKGEEELEQLDDLHVLIEARSEQSMNAASAMVEKLLTPVDLKKNEVKLAQLRELAVLKGTLRPHINSKKLCDTCGDASHFTSACPLTASNLGFDTNEHRVNFLDEFKGAFSSFTAPKNPKKEINYRRLFVACLPRSVDDNKLLELFSPFGKVIDKIVIKDKATGLHKGYGFVKFSDANSASEAVSRMNGYKIDGKTLDVKIAGMDATPSKPKTHVGGLLGLPNKLPTYPGYAAIARSEPASTAWPGPPGSMLPAYQSSGHGQSSALFTSSDELASFPGYLKSFDPPSQLHQQPQNKELPSSQAYYSTTRYGYSYYTPPP